jgi:hypothetical protein
METNDGPKWIHRLGSARAGYQNAPVTDLAASADQFARRAELYERFAVVPVAFSINGRQVGFVGLLDAGITVGGIAVVEHDDGLVAVHVHDVQLETRQGTREIGADDDEVTVGFAMRHVRGTGVVIGVLGDDGLTVADQLAAFGERRVRAVLDRRRGAPGRARSGEGTDRSSDREPRQPVEDASRSPACTCSSPRNARARCIPECSRSATTWS